ncbi:MAG: EAL domain-containing protein [Zoogloea sp.]|nr:EAL domain-containing protein [Zoogloea sp.]
MQAPPSGIQLRIKFSLIVMLVVLAGMGSVIYMASHMLENLIRESTEKQLAHTNRLVTDLIETNQEGARLAIERFGQAFNEHFKGRYQLLAKPGSRTRRLYLNGKPVAALGADIATFSRNAGGHVATIFERDGNDFRRVVTSLRKEDGTLAIGTYLGRSSPAFAALEAGENYLGQSYLFGRYYMTLYRPITNAEGVTVAVLFVGMDLTSNIESIRNKVRQFRYGSSGYAFIIDGRPGKDYGRLLVHPAKEGQTLFQTPTIAAMLLRRTGTIHYDWHNPELGDKGPREKVAVLSEYRPFEWVVGTSAYIDDSLALVRRGRDYFIAGTLVVTVLIISFLNLGIGRLVLTPLENLTGRLSRVNRTLRVLSLCNESVVHARSEPELLQRIVQLLISVGGYRQAWIAFGGTSREQALQVAASAGPESGYLAKLIVDWDQLEPAELPHARSQAEKRMQVVQDCLESRHPLLRLVGQAGSTLSLIACPLLDANGHALGTLVIESSHARSFDQEAISLLSELSADLAYGIESLRSAQAKAEAEAALNLRERAIESSSEAILIAACEDERTHIIDANPATTLITGRPHEELMGEDIARLLGDASGRTAALYRQGGGLTLQAPHKDGSLYWGEVFLWPVAAEEPAGRHVVCVIKNVSDRVAYEKQLEHQASYDALTGVANRSLLMDRLGQQIAQAERHHEPLAVAFIDLDHFKLVNDTLGHPVGDCLLQAVAGRIMGVIRDEDTISRQGGDEFVLLFPDFSSESDLFSILQRIGKVLDEPFLIGGRELHISASIGVSTYPKDGQDRDTLLRHADIAMYRAKEAGRNAIRFFTEDMNQRIQERLELLGELRHAIARQQLYLCYQPQIELATGRTLGVEALLRWRHPTLGEVSPARFIPVAEETELILPIGEWVLRQACHDACRWQQAGHPQLRVAVNVSARQFRQNLPEVVSRILAESGLQPANLELEITESHLMDDPAASAAKLEALSALGIRLSLDDFGTGYSSLAYLTRFSLDTLKIDRSFVQRLNHDASALSITRTIIAMARNLHMTVLAEGVEAGDQLQLLTSQGCEQVQGYYFARPMQFEVLNAWLHEREEAAHTA